MADNIWLLAHNNNTVYSRQVTLTFEMTFLIRKMGLTGPIHHVIIFRYTLPSQTSLGQP